ncbi:hypothetical protein HII36_55485, partial [Nonomuraea sp. NN258]|uniref:hypothetical protein n=1 Tax=Nonomuraea antri TaxID=2730852 RepID=UPI001C2CBAF1
PEAPEDDPFPELTERQRKQLADVLARTAAEAMVSTLRAEFMKAFSPGELSGDASQGINIRNLRLALRLLEGRDEETDDTAGDTGRHTAGGTVGGTGRHTGGGTGGGTSGDPGGDTSGDTSGDTGGGTGGAAGPADR